MVNVTTQHAVTPLIGDCYTTTLHVHYFILLYIHYFILLHVHYFKFNVCSLPVILSTSMFVIYCDI